MIQHKDFHYIVKPLCSQKKLCEKKYPRNNKIINDGTTVFQFYQHSKNNWYYQKKLCFNENNLPDLQPVH